MSILHDIKYSLETPFCVDALYIIIWVNYTSDK